eukprot:scaffold268200_cov53-Prasinocladus_malaysianus.AAC.1
MEDGRRALAEAAAMAGVELRSVQTLAGGVIKVRPGPQIPQCTIYRPVVYGLSRVKVLSLIIHQATN